MGVQGNGEKLVSFHCSVSDFIPDRAGCSVLAPASGHTAGSCFLVGGCFPPTYLQTAILSSHYSENPTTGCLPHLSHVLNLVFHVGPSLKIMAVQQFGVQESVALPPNVCGLPLAILHSHIVIPSLGVLFKSATGPVPHLPSITITSTRWG